MTRHPEDWIEVDPRPGMVAVACICVGFLAVVAAVVWGCL